MNICTQENEWTALYAAARSNYDVVVKILIEDKAKVKLQFDVAESVRLVEYANSTTTLK